MGESNAPPSADGEASSDVGNTAGESSGPASEGAAIDPSNAVEDVSTEDSRPVDEPEGFDVGASNVEKAGPPHALSETSSGHAYLMGRGVV
jgi:hypothetical protein